MLSDFYLANHKWSICGDFPACCLIWTAQTSGFARFILSWFLPVFKTFMFQQQFNSNHQFHLTALPPLILNKLPKILVQLKC